MPNSSSLLELFEILEDELQVKLRYTRLPWRHSDQKFFVANNSKAQSSFGWVPRISKRDGILKTIEWASKAL
jgi:CDP-paratose 2-epimerase